MLRCNIHVIGKSSAVGKNPAGRIPSAWMAGIAVNTRSSPMRASVASAPVPTMPRRSAMRAKNSIGGPGSRMIRPGGRTTIAIRRAISSYVKISPPGRSSRWPALAERTAAAISAEATSAARIGCRRPVANDGNGRKCQRRTHAASRLMLRSRPSPQINVGRSTVQAIPACSQQAIRPSSARLSRSARARSAGLLDACLVTALVELSATKRRTPFGRVRSSQLASASSGPALRIVSTDGHVAPERVRSQSTPQCHVAESDRSVGGVTARVVACTRPGWARNCRSRFVPTSPVLPRTKIRPSMPSDWTDDAACGDGSLMGAESNAWEP